MSYPFTAIVFFAFCCTASMVMVARIWWLDNKEESE